MVHSQTDDGPQIPPAPGGSAYAQTLLGKVDHRVLGHQAARWGMVFAVGLMLVVSSRQFVRKIQQTEYSEHRQRESHRSAIGRWLPDARILEAGGDPYGDKHWFPNPPMVLILLVPLAHLADVSIVLMAVVWSILKIAAVVSGCWMLIAAARREGIGVPLGVMLMAAVYSARPILGDITHGNINIFVFWEIALAWYLFVQHRDLLAGVVVGAALVTKVTPGLLLVYFLYKGAWRVVAGAVVSVLMLAGVLPSLILGFERNVHLLTGWFDMMVRLYVFHGFVTAEPKNQSLPGTLLRVLSYPGWIELQHLTLEYAGTMAGSIKERFGEELGAMAKPASTAVAVLLKGANLAIIAALAWLCRTPLKDRRDPRLLLELSLILLAMLLLSERTWKHHLTTLPIVYLATWLVLTCYPWTRRFRAVFVVGLVVQLLLLLLIQGKVALFVGVITLGLLLCFVQNAALLLGLRRTAAIDGS